MKCCVIGGTGFIGHHLVKLLSKDRKVTVIGRNDFPTRQLPLNVTYIAGDYGDKYFLKGILNGMDEVINLAYSTVPKTSYDNPTEDILNNVPPSINFFKLALYLCIKKVIIISSGGAIYGKVNHLPISENVIPNPISPYGITKLAIEKYANMYYLKGLPIICIRPSNVYGEGQFPFRSQGFIPTLISSILQNIETDVYGEEQIRDLLYVEDAVRGIASILNHGKIGECYNLGSGIGVTNSEIINIIKEISSPKKVLINNLEPRIFDVPSNVLDYSKIKSDTEWSPSTNLYNGLKKTWKYYEG